jgi:hypothetical protein
LILPQMTVVLNQAIEADHESDARDAFEVFENLLIVVCVSVIQLTLGIVVGVKESTGSIGILC